MSDTEPQMQNEDDKGAGSMPVEKQSAPVTETPVAAPVTETKAAKTRRGHLPRRISAWVLVVLASILIPVSVISVWAIRTVTNTDQYVKTMAPLAAQPGHCGSPRCPGDRRARSRAGS